MHLSAPHSCSVFLLQGPEHPNPGKPFTARGFPRQCYLPDNAQGRKVKAHHHPWGWALLLPGLCPPASARWVGSGGPGPARQREACCPHSPLLLLTLLQQEEGTLTQAG